MILVGCFNPSFILNTKACSGFVVTNENSPSGCCYLKGSSLVNKRESDLALFPSNIVGQTFKKDCGQCILSEPNYPGYQFLDYLDSPNYDISETCSVTLKACIQLCDNEALSSNTLHRCVGFVFNFNQGCCYLKNSIGPYSLKDWWTGFGVSYERISKFGVSDKRIRRCRVWVNWRFVALNAFDYLQALQMPRFLWSTASPLIPSRSTSAAAERS